MQKTLHNTAIEAGKVLDTLAALSMELSCHREASPDELVLSAGKLKEACEAIDDAVASLKRILAITDAHGASIFGEGSAKPPGTP